MKVSCLRWCFCGHGLADGVEQDVGELKYIEQFLQRVYDLVGLGVAEDVDDLAVWGLAERVDDFLDGEWRLWGRLDGSSMRPGWPSHKHLPVWQGHTLLVHCPRPLVGLALCSQVDDGAKSDVAWVGLAHDIFGGSLRKNVLEARVAGLDAFEADGHGRAPVPQPGDCTNHGRGVAGNGNGSGRGGGIGFGEQESSQPAKTSS